MCGPARRNRVADGTTMRGVYSLRGPASHYLFGLSRGRMPYRSGAAIWDDMGRGVEEGRRGSGTANDMRREDEERMRAGAYDVWGDKERARGGAIGREERGRRG